MGVSKFSGIKAAYLYPADDGRTYLILRNVVLASIPGCNLKRASVNSPNAGSIPKGLKCRGVYWQGILDGRRVRKFLICGTSSALYESMGSVEVTIDGVVGVTTRRRGEVASYPKLQLEDRERSL